MLGGQQCVRLYCRVVGGYLLIYLHLPSYPLLALPFLCKSLSILSLFLTPCTLSTTVSGPLSQDLLARPVPRLPRGVPHLPCGLHSQGGGHDLVHARSGKIDYLSILNFLVA